MDSKRTVIYPGTFDPVTNGHIDIMKRACMIFSHVIVAVLDNKDKSCFFSRDERAGMIRDAAKEAGLSVEVVSFSGLLVDLAKEKKTGIVVRGLRALSDFEYEFQMAIMNREIGGVESVFLMTDKEYFYLSSSAVKEIARLGGDASRFVPRSVDEKLKDRQGSRN